MRKLKKKPLTRAAKIRSLLALDRLRLQGESVELVLNQAEDKCYTGLYPVHESYYLERGLNKPPTQKMAAFVVRHTNTEWAE
jgi:hypothetical protein